jgi:hypothetical protein
MSDTRRSDVRLIIPIAAPLCVISCPAIAAAAPTTIVVDPMPQGPAITDRILGVNMGNWFNQSQPVLASALRSVGIKSLRWPGGSVSDLFHWRGNFDCLGGYVDQRSTFDSLVQDVQQPANADLAVTVNYGSNAACDGGGDPAEAATWVAYAKSQGYAVSNWTVGNEVYGSWETDLHPIPNDAATYAVAVATGYYPAMKAADPTAQIGVVVEPQWNAAWDAVVLSQATYDFVEYHWYGQGPGWESDNYLLNDATTVFAAQLAALRQELAVAGHPATPIYVGELGSVVYAPGKQTTSITQALFAGQVIGEMMNAGISRATWWLGFGSCSDGSAGANFSNSLYGWQTFGGYMVFSDGTPTYGCPNAPIVPLGTPLPTARALQLMSLIALPGEHSLPVSIGGAASSAVRAYAATHAGGVAIVVFNLSATAPASVSVGVSGTSSSSAILLDAYDKAAYDLSAANLWVGPSEQQLGPSSLPLNLTLTPWSMTVMRISP